MSAPQPHSLESERAVIGAVMINPEQMEDEDVSALLPEDFYRSCHGVIWELIWEQYSKGDPITMTALVEEAVKRGMADQVGSLRYLSSIPDNIPSSENAGYYARNTKEAAQKRILLQEITWVSEGISSGQIDVPTAVAAIEGAATKAFIKGDNDGVEVGDALIELRGTLLSEAAGQSKMLLPTGIEVLDTDRELGGWITHGITLIIGASGMGKTSLLNRTGLGAARYGMSVAIYGTETEVQRRTRDLTFSLAGVDQRSWGWLCRLAEEAQERGYRLDGESGERLAAMQQKLERAMIELDRLGVYVFRSNKNVDTFAAAAMRRHKKKPIQMLIVDYIQGFNPSRGVGMSDKDQVGYASGRLRQLQKDLGCAMLVGSQRSGEKTLNPKDNDSLIPQMTDAQYSSKIHQDAEEVYALYRADYYRERYPELSFKGSPGYIEIVSRKRRKGKHFRLEVPFHGPHQWVGDRPQSWMF